MTDRRRLAENAAENLEEVATWFDELVEDRVPGTRRRWHQRRGQTLPAAHRCGTPWVFDVPIDIPGRDGRPGRTVQRPRCPNPECSDEAAIGFSPSPARDDVLDAISDVTWTVIDLRDRLAAAMNADRRRINVPQACRWISSALPTLNDRELLEKIADEAQRLASVVRIGTGRSEDVIQLDAGCPICGQETLLAYAARMAVTCVGEECVCDLHDCGCQRGFKHTWQEHDLVWLARVLNAEEETA